MRCRAPRSVALCLLAAALALPLSGCIHLDLGLGRGGKMKERVLEGTARPKVLLVEIDGVLTEEEERESLGLEGREAITSYVYEVLQRAKEDPDVRALVLRINSPGGTITASDVVYEEIRRFKAETSLPIVVQMMGIAASGGYYVAMAGDRIYANPTTVTGSIGVIFVGVNLSGFLQKLGIADQTLVAGARKDSGSWLRPMRPEERAQLQGVLDEMHGRFESVVAQGRPSLTRARVDELADGRVYTAEQAKENGLVDEIGYLPDSIAYAAAQAGLAQGDYRVVTYARSRERKENIYSKAGPAAEPDARAMPETIRLELPRELARPNGQAGFLYLWAPGVE
ncbi:MAG TPA: signal peptide peptidase SppA [Myxococcota bacterium]|nr:signal peptide peptidase SppA [Myxococcota bacterium]